jgi:uncharacterized protein YecT (DUF1311 family)
MRSIVYVSALLMGAANACAAAPDKLDDINTAYEYCIASATATVTTKECGSTAFESVDAALNATYKAIIARLAGPDDAETLSRLKAAQRAWLPFRDAQCELEAAESLGGTNEGVIFNSCTYEQTRERVKALRRQFESNE